MGEENILVSPKEAKLMLLIDSTFNYDDLLKARKLRDRLEQKGSFKSVQALNFAKKFEDYSITGVIGACCPVCNAFAEGKGRLLCSDCIEDLDKISKMPQKNENKPVVSRKIEPVKKPEQIKKVKAAEEIIEELKPILQENTEAIKASPVIDKKDYYVIKKTKFYCYLAAALALAIMINFVVAFTAGNKFNKNEVEVAQVEEPLLPASHE